MDDTISSLDSLFRQFASPVVAVKGSEIIYCNAAAELFFSGSAVSSDAGRHFPGWPYPAGAVVSETISSRRCTITVSSLNGVRVLTITDESDQGSPGIPIAAMSYLLGNANTIRLAAEVITKKYHSADDRKFEQYMSALNQSCCRLQRAADGLSALSLLSSGDYPFAPQPLELGTFISDIVSSVRSLTSPNEVVVEYTPPSDLIVINGDAQLIEKMVFAVIANSLGHITSGGRIKLGLQSTQAAAVISVDDDGSGMGPEQLSQLFRLSPVSGVDGIPGPECGIGLPLAAAVASRHNGTIIVESRPGRGTSVRLMLRCDTEGSSSLHSPMSSGLNLIPSHALIELSAVLSSECYEFRQKES